MSRAKLTKGKQKEFLESVARRANLDWTDIANLSNVCERTLRDWRREKLNMSYEALIKLSEVSRIPVPEGLEILPEHWSTKKASKIGAVKRYKLYGNPGTIEGRRKGGMTAQKKFREDPDYAKKLGIKIRKDIRRPNPSPLLAEFVGIMLGDGGINNYQAAISYNNKTDEEYGVFVRQLVYELFGVSSSIDRGAFDNCSKVVMSSKNLVEFLEEIGLKRGNKVHNKVALPKWIWRNRGYQVAALRGLMDTDGSFYSYRHRVHGKVYYNGALCLTNHSDALLRSAFHILEMLNFHPIKSGKHVYLHRRKEVDSYFEIVGSNNPKHVTRYHNFISGKN